MRGNTGCPDSQVGARAPGWRAGWVLALALTACNERYSSPEAAPVAELASAPLASASVSAAAALSARPAMLSPELQRKMKVAAPIARPQRLAITAGVLGQLTDAALILRSLPDGREQHRYPLTDPRRLTSLADGSLLAFGERALLHVRKDAKSQLFTRVSLFASASIYADLVAQRRFWLDPGFGDALYGYELIATDRPLLPVTGRAELVGYDRRAFGPLASGAFLYTTSTGLQQTYPAGKTKRLSFDASEAWRILPTQRPDRAWLIEKNGSGVLLELHPSSGKVLRRAEFTFEDLPYDASADGKTLAVLLLEQPDDVAWRFRVELYDAAAKRQWSRRLPPLSLQGENWPAQLREQGELALGVQSGVVAIGGAGRVVLLRLIDGVPLPLETP